MIRGCSQDGSSPSRFHQGGHDPDQKQSRADELGHVLSRSQEGVDLLELEMASGGDSARRFRQALDAADYAS